MSTGTPSTVRKAHANVASGGNGRATVVAKTYPAPAHLATPTDLRAQDAQAITEAINPLVADLFALYLKTKNFHWHLSGPHFRDYHLLFDEQAEAIFAATDQLAEGVRKIGGTTIRSISHISQLQTIADDNQAFVPPLEMAARLMNDNAALVRNMRTAHEVCDRARDYATASILEVLIDEAERRTWFLFEVTQAGDTSV